MDMIPVYAIIQARMSSERLPGKVLRKVHGIPLLGYLIDRLEHCDGLDGIVIATSSEPIDEEIVEYAVERRIPCYTGVKSDVMARIIDCGKRFGIEHMVRISGDSPFLDPSIVSHALDIYRREKPDIVSNVQIRSFPKGQSVEIFSLETLSEAWCSGVTDFEKEHVTPFFYRHPEKYSITNITYPELRGDVQLSVDTEQDMARFEAIAKCLGAPYWQHGLGSILKEYDAMYGTLDESA